MKIVYTLIVVQVMKTARAMKAIRKIMNGRAGHKGRTDYAGEKVMRPGTELEDSFRNETSKLFIIYNPRQWTPACQATQKQLATLHRCIKCPSPPLEAPQWASQRKSLPGWWDEGTAPGAAGRRARGEEIKGGVEKPLPGRWDEVTTLESCKWETFWLGKSRKSEKQIRPEKWLGRKLRWNSPPRRPINFSAKPYEPCQRQDERRFPPTYLP